MTARPRRPRTRPANPVRPSTAIQGRKAASLEEAFRLRTEPVDGGHLRWTGYVNRYDLPCLRHDYQEMTAYRVAFRLRTGREPVGYVRPDCELPGCVAHVDDRPGRARTAALLVAIFGQGAAA